nr:zinc finger protein 235-like isoform X3 [Dermacentor andersoni]
MSLAESFPAKMECHAPSKIVGQVEVGMQCNLPLADKSVGCCFKAWSESRSVQTTETVEQLTSTSASRPPISPSTATCDNTKQGFLHRCDLCDHEADKLFHLDAHASIDTDEKPYQCPSCSRSFSRKSHLKIHLRTHTGNKVLTYSK